MKYKVKELTDASIKACLEKLPVLKYLGKVQYNYAENIDNPPMWIKEECAAISFVPTDIEFHHHEMMSSNIPKINGFHDGVSDSIFLQMHKTKEFFLQRKGKASRKTEVIFIDTKMDCWAIEAYLEDHREEVSAP